MQPVHTNVHSGQCLCCVVCKLASIALLGWLKSGYCYNTKIRFFLPGFIFERCHEKKKKDFCQCENKDTDQLCSN